MVLVIFFTLNKEKYKEIKERKTEGKKEKREREGGRKEGR